MKDIARGLAVSLLIYLAAFFCPALAEGSVSISRWLSSGTASTLLNDGNSIHAGLSLASTPRICTQLSDRPYRMEEPDTEPVSGFETAMLSLLLPGAGHLNLRTINAGIGGLIHIGMEMISIIGFLWMYMDAKREYEESKSNNSSWAPSIDWSGSVIAFGAVLMILHRIECLIEGLIWCNHENKKRERKGLLSGARISLMISPVERSIGTCFSLIF